MPDSGRLTIETATAWLGEPGACKRDMQPGQYVAICVTDTGTSMSPEVMARALTRSSRPSQSARGPGWASP